ncbi:MAG: hypothetical protein HC797_06315 [Anaerolineales bacterium]|nr:hypothetical protein [Anaerolineales bacterium]
MMIVLNGEFQRQEVQKRSINLISDLSLEYDVLISCKFTSAESYAKSKMPLMLNIRKDGVAI